MPLLLPAQNNCYNDQAKITKVMIDPGHGGKDPGTVYKNISEKDINLSVALKLGDLIRKNLKDVEVMYTRSDDTFIGLADRSTKANRAGADVFISIHTNGHHTASANGTETYILGVNDSKDNLELVMKENDVIIYEDDYRMKYEGYNPGDPSSFIMFSLMQYAYRDQSMRLAETIQKHYTQDLPMRDRGAKQGSLLVLKNTSMPSVLTEVGFVTNSDDRKNITTEKGQMQVARALFNAFSEYKSKVEGRGHVVLLKDQPAASATVAQATSQARPEASAPAVQSSQVASYVVAAPSKEVRAQSDAVQGQAGATPQTQEWASNAGQGQSWPSSSSQQRPAQQEAWPQQGTSQWPAQQETQQASSQWPAAQTGSHSTAWPVDGQPAWPAAQTGSHSSAWPVADETSSWPSSRQQADRSGQSGLPAQAQTTWDSSGASASNTQEWPPRGTDPWASGQQQTTAQWPPQQGNDPWASQQGSSQWPAQQTAEWPAQPATQPQWPPQGSEQWPPAGTQSSRPSGQGDQWPSSTQSQWPPSGQELAGWGDTQPQASGNDWLGQVNAANNSGILFYVQLAAADKPMSANHHLFKSYRGQVVEKRVGGYYKYMIGGYRTFEEASRELTAARREIKDAFIVAYEGDVLVKLEDARRRTRY